MGKFDLAARDCRNRIPGRAGEEFEQASGDDAHASAGSLSGVDLPDGRSSRSDAVPAPNKMPVEISAADLLFPSIGLLDT